MNHFGFSLIELMVAVGLFSIVSFAGLNQIVTLNVLRKMVEAKTNGRMDAKLLTIYITNNMQQIGGGPVRPWMAILDENNCAASGVFPACQGSDRITYALVNNSINTCTIQSTTGTNILNFDPIASSQCCSNSMLHLQVALVSGSYYAHYFITKVVGPSVPAPNSCSVTLAPGQLQGLNPTYGPPNFSSFAGGSMTVENVATLYLDPVNYVLHSYTDYNNDGNLDTGVVLPNGTTVNDDTVLADQVVDLQIILGFDAPPQDGVITNLNSDKDEWLYNSTMPLEALQQGGLTTATMVDLRGIGVGVITSSPGNSTVAGSETQLFDGPSRSVQNYFLTSSQSRIYFRSVNVINN
jgi:prepilin-type N-terminal cleavage/methylation domain-containing protein